MKLDFKIKLIAGMTEENCIGLEDDSLPFQSKEDMRFFRDTTRDNVVIMGSKTFETLGCKPLPGRINVVLSSQESYKTMCGSDGNEGLFVFKTIDEVLEFMIGLDKNCGGTKRFFVIGGCQIYKKFLELGLVDEMYINIIKAKKTDLTQKVYFPVEYLKDYKLGLVYTKEDMSDGDDLIEKRFYLR